MKLNWFQKKEKKPLPGYFLAYQESFLNAKKLPIKETRFVIYDTETTGFLRKDRVLSIGAVSVIDNTINVNDTFEVYVKQKVFKAETVPIHGILKGGEIEKITELAALKLFLKYIGNAVLVGHHVKFDVEMINEILRRNKLPLLLNKTIDTGYLYKKSKHTIYQNGKQHYTLDNLCDELNISKSDRHTATGDAYITAIAFLKILSRLNKNGNLKFRDLLNY
ncbi:DNA polymerase-3 subunit epsilon [Polaribacter sp. KT25b]|uniref:3'-5' exonuclease n=1 Tax=Polaribacter sp. KT25b TaxID=1855336 RepID=UPI00087C586B|nr:3'-5' exonuclease [Polaribacter sp. KT25b]SDS15636.1 DNA polymerase-3 subunit epsilon [Polaribacter sp. KT25b]